MAHKPGWNERPLRGGGKRGADVFEPYREVVALLVGLESFCLLWDWFTALVSMVIVGARDL